LDEGWTDRALNNLLDIREVFHNNNLTFWLDYGTLLGAIRNKKLVKSMQDLDLGIMDDDWKLLTSLQNRLKKIGFMIELKQFNVDGNIYRTMKLTRNNVSIDLSIYKILFNYAIDIHGSFTRYYRPLMAFRLPFYFFPLRRDVSNKIGIISRHFDILPPVSIMPPQYLTRWLMGWKSYYCNIVPKLFFEKMEKIKLYDDYYSIPSFSESYLSYTYGSDWLIPNKNYKNYKDSRGYKIILTDQSIELDDAPSI
jgi:phosphorylcholine metabolism protein LicD